MPIHVVLIEPEIPQNTGNIIRTCACTGSSLHLVKPLGFSMTEKYLKRAGLDYIDLVPIFYYNSFEEIEQKYGEKSFFFFSTKAHKNHTDVTYEDDCILVFGKETRGIDEKILSAHWESVVRIPMINTERARSLNLSNSVSIAVYEAIRQIGYDFLR